MRDQHTFIPISRNSGALDVGGVADGLDDGGVEGGGFPSGDGGLHEGVVVSIDSVRPMVAAKVVPEVLDRVEFWTVSGKSKHCDGAWDLQTLATMEAGSVPNHHHVHVVGDGLCELAKECVHHIRVHMRCDDRFRLSGLRTDGTDHVQIIVLRLPSSGGSLSASSPQAREGALLAKARFVLKEDLQFLPRLQTLQFSELCGECLF